MSVVCVGLVTFLNICAKGAASADGVAGEALRVRRGQGRCRSGIDFHTNVAPVVFRYKSKLDAAFE